MKTCLLFSFLWVVLFPSAAFAGGSVGYDDVALLLDKKPALKKLILSTFNVPKVGDAVRLGRHFEHLGGARIAPYEFVVTSKVSGKKFLLSIQCDTVFVDADGKPIKDDVLKATGVKETMTHFSVAEVKEQK